MKKVIKSTIKINRPMVFLCGPYYEEKPYDRRKILKDFLTSGETKHEVIPIIVDKFLDKKNINDDTINIDLLEEICAAVSFKTYIFLDTFSSVAELGMFCSKAYQNQIDIFIPKSSDIIINNIGYFVREIIENNNNEKIKCVYYRPRIVRVPLASEYVTEFYEFANNKLPQNIRDRIINDKVFATKEYDIGNGGGESSGKNDQVSYQKNGTKFNFEISIRMLFYLIVSIAQSRGVKDITTKEFVDEIVTEFKVILRDSYCKSAEIDQLEIKTKIEFSVEAIIKHILVFIKLYSNYSSSEGRHIITEADSLIREIKSFEYLEISQQHENVISEYLSSPDNFVETIKMKRGKKTRKITKYKDDENGERLREFHNMVLNKFQELHSFSDNSYAYRKGFSISDCITQHRRSISFLKADITNFFNSIKYNELYNSCKGVVSEHFVLDKNFGNLIKSCMYNNKLPLGLITSPIFSDLYLHEFDKNVSQILNEYDKRIIYTRYADDMIFSSEEELESNDIDYITNLLKQQLAKIDLELNQKKTVFKTLGEPGDHIKLLGLNIVKADVENKITVGKKYIYETCKMYLDYLDNRSHGRISEESRFYTEKRIAGRVAYIHQIEGSVGYEILRKRIKKVTNNRVDISNNKIEFFKE